MTHFFPIGLGTAMGAMMIWMVHNGGGDWALGFVLAHVALALVALSAVFLAARWGLPRRMGWLTRLHRPQLPHVVPMIGGAVGAGVIACVGCAMGYWGAV